MKKILLTFLSSALVYSIQAQNAIPNPGFETWNVNPNYDDPQGWGTINGLTYILGVKTVTKTTDKHIGTYAMKLESKTVPLQGVAPGIAATGTINAQTQGVDGGVAFNKRPISMSGWFKYTPNGVDTGSVEAILSKWSGGQRVQVGRAEFQIAATTSTYTQFNVNFSYSSSNTPDTLVMIILTSSGANSSPNGTVMFIDDLAFDYCSNFSISASNTAATCTAADGSVTVANTNGVSPLTYAWSGGGTSATETKAAGTYTVTVTDANACTLTATTIVSTNSVTLGVTASSTATACSSNTGTATASTADGTSPYSYLWSNNSNSQNPASLGAGSYTVTITDSKGCTGTASASVTTPNGPSATQVTTNVSCFGLANGAIDVTVTGGTGNLGFVWSPNVSNTEDATGLAAGNYVLTVSDANNCSFVVNASVTEPAALSISETHANVSCNGGNDGSIALSITGGTPSYTPVWSPANANPVSLAAGNYSITVTDNNNCTASSTITITQPAALVLSTTSVDATAPNATDGSADATVSGGVTAYTYLWSNNSTTPTATGLAPGNYCVTVTDANGCSATSCALVSAPSGVNDVVKINYSLYPNPASSFITLQSDELKGAMFRLYATDGSLKAEHVIATTKETIGLSELPQGVYTYKISAKGLETAKGTLLIVR